MNSTIRQQLASEEWQYRTRYWLECGDDRCCEECDRSTGLIVYLRRIYLDIEFIWNYPDSAYGVLCSEHAALKERREKEMSEAVSTWSIHELDSLLDTLDVINSIDNNRLVAVNRLYGEAKRSKYG